MRPVPSPPHPPLPQPFLDQIAHKASEKRLAAWIGFIVLSLTLGCLFPWLTYVHNVNTGLVMYHWPLFVIWGPGETYTYYYDSFNTIRVPYIAIIGAIGAAGIGLLFLLSKKKQPFLDIFGGVALSVIAFTYFTFSWYINPSRTYLNFYRFYWNADPLLLFCNEFIYIALFSLWSFIGTRYFLRSANTPGRLLFGTLLIVIFIVNNIFIAIYAHYFLTLSNWGDGFHLNVFLWITFLPLGLDSLRALIFGAVAIRIALRNRKSKTAP